MRTILGVKAKTLQRKRGLRRLGPADPVELGLDRVHRSAERSDDLGRLLRRVAVAGAGEVAEQADLLQGRLRALGRQPLKPLLLRLALYRFLLLAHDSLLVDGEKFVPVPRFLPSRCLRYSSVMRSASGMDSVRFGVS